MNRFLANQPGTTGLMLIKTLKTLIIIRFSKPGSSQDMEMSLILSSSSSLLLLFLLRQSSNYLGFLMGFPRQRCSDSSSPWSWLWIHHRDDVFFFSLLMDSPGSHRRSCRGVDETYVSNTWMNLKSSGVSREQRTEKSFWTHSCFKGFLMELGQKGWRLSGDWSGLL